MSTDRTWDEFLPIYQPSSETEIEKEKDTHKSKKTRKKSKGRIERVASEPEQIEEETDHTEKKKQDNHVMYISGYEKERDEIKQNKKGQAASTEKTNKKQTERDTIDARLQSSSSQGLLCFTLTVCYFFLSKHTCLACVCLSPLVLVFKHVFV